MATREDIQKYSVKRILLKGPTYSGKTHNAILFAVDYSLRGQEVLYLDLFEISAANELLLRTDIELKNITYIPIDSFKQLIEITETLPILKPKLVIVDAGHYSVQLARAETRTEILAQGTYRVGDSHTEIKIENPHLFDLVGWLYQIPSRDVVTMISNLIKSRCDLVFTLDDTYPKVAEYLVIDGRFDYVLRLSRCIDAKGIPEYSFQIDKFRGKPLKNYGSQKIPDGMGALNILDTLISK